MRSSDIVPFSEARARLTDLAEDVVRTGQAKVITRNGASYVALVDARELDRLHALEAEHGHLLLLDEVDAGLRQWLDGERLPDGALDAALSTPLVSGAPGRREP